MSNTNNTPPRKATIRDVARAVGVHHSSVSRALNPNTSSRISPEMAGKIHRAAEKLGYMPNIAASSLKQNRSFALGVLVPDITNPVFPPIIRGIQKVAEEAGFTVLIANTDDEESKEQEALKMMNSRSVEGLIAATARRQDPLVEECIKRHMPFVLVNRSVDEQNVNAVVLDEAKGMRSILDYLLSLGHKRIAHIAGPQFSSTGYERAKEFSIHMQANNLDGTLVEEAKKYTFEEGRRAFHVLIEHAPDITAIAAGNDTLALGCLDAMAVAKKRCPEDISVVGVNDIPFLSRMNPSLTTLSVPKYEMGIQSSRILLDLIKEPSRASIIMRMQPNLIRRGSTAELASAPTT